MLFDGDNKIIKGGFKGVKLDVKGNNRRYSSKYYSRN